MTSRYDTHKRRAALETLTEWADELSAEANRLAAGNFPKSQEAASVVGLNGANLREASLLLRRLLLHGPAVGPLGSDGADARERALITSAGRNLYLPPSTHAPTPGPWMVQRDWSFNVNGAGQHIAKVILDAKRSAECWANACLVKAAPKLLDACRLAYPVLSGHPGPDSGDIRPLAEAHAAKAVMDAVVDAQAGDE